MTEGFNKYNVKLEEVFMERNFNYDDVPVVETQSGLLKGYSMDQVYIFKGIPYAQAKRFHMPEPVTPWEGVRDATSYGFVCPLPHRYRNIKSLFFKKAQLLGNILRSIKNRMYYLI